MDILRAVEEDKLRCADNDDFTACAMTATNREYVQLQLEVLPNELLTLSPSSISSLQNLSLARNRLLNMSDELYIFTSLRVLNLSRNKLLGLPSGISSLAQLEELNLLSNNTRISALPIDELLGMSSLKVLDLRCKWHAFDKFAMLAAHK